jgi:hypothetical protein
MGTKTPENPQKTGKKRDEISLYGNRKDVRNLRSF